MNYILDQGWAFYWVRSMMYAHPTCKTHEVGSRFWCVLCLCESFNTYRIFSSWDTTIWLVQNVVHDLGGGKYNSVPCILDCMLDLA